MYNGIGLQTARGTGTSGYIQTNLAGAKFAKKPEEDNLENDIAKSEFEINREPNVELLMHERKRQIEIRCLELEDKLEDEEINEVEIMTQVSELRAKLLKEFEKGSLDFDGQLNLSSSHVRQMTLKENRARMRKALSIDKAFVDGKCFQEMTKNSL
uniref:Cwf21 domain-containing protein n=1 Tax=Rhabditophanes sp. KR3021 TaxID=114890 RepID=A0AC35TFW6_9BILA